MDETVSSSSRATQPAFAAAVRMFLADTALQERLRAAAAPSVARFQQDAVYGRLEEILRAVA